MVYFSEDFVVGFFGFGRTYGASARFECDTIAALEVDWPEALAATARWREQRKEKATALHLFFQAPAAQMWEAIAFVKAKVLVPPDALAPALDGLFVRVYVLTPDLEHYLYAELFPEATRKAEPTNG